MHNWKASLQLAHCRPSRAVTWFSMARRGRTEGRVMLTDNLKVPVLLSPQAAGRMQHSSGKQQWAWTTSVIWASDYSFISLLDLVIYLWFRRAIVRTVSYRLLIKETQVQFQRSPCKISHGTGATFSPSTANFVTASCWYDIIFGAAAPEHTVSPHFCYL
jgi:hypothetical protein